MERHEYSADAVKKSFWFIEFKDTVEALASGKTLEDIRSLSADENFYHTTSQARADLIYKTMAARVKAIGQDGINIFMNSDVFTRKLVNLVAIMSVDTLFFDFVYETVRVKMISEVYELSRNDVDIFFREKQMQNEKVACWTDITLKRLGGYYLTVLYNAGIIDGSKPIRNIRKPFLDEDFENWLNASGRSVVIKALTGVR